MKIKNPLDIEGRWTEAASYFYTNVVARNLGPIFEEVVPRAMPPLPAGSRVLDVGCGPGNGTCIVARHLAECHVLGLDLSEVMLRYALRNGREVANVSFRLGDAMSLLFPSDTFALVYSIGSVKSWPDPQRGVNEMCRVTAPSGTGMLVEVDRDCSEADARAFASHLESLPAPLRDGFAHGFRRRVAGVGFDRAALADSMGRAGFADVAVARLEHIPILVCSGTK